MSQTINDRISIILKDSGLSQTALAETLETSQQHISRLIHGKCQPSRQFINNLCAVYKINKVWLCKGCGSKKQTDLESPLEYMSIANLIENKTHPFYSKIISIIQTYEQLSPSSQAAIDNYITELFKNIK